MRKWLKFSVFFLLQMSKPRKYFPSIRATASNVSTSLRQIFKLRVFVVFYSEAIAKPSRHCIANYDIRHFFFACTAQWYQSSGIYSAKRQTSISPSTVPLRHSARTVRRSRQSNLLGSIRWCLTFSSLGRLSVTLTCCYFLRTVLKTLAWSA